MCVRALRLCFVPRLFNSQARFHAPIVLRVMEVSVVLGTSVGAGSFTVRETRSEANHVQVPLARGWLIHQ